MPLTLTYPKPKACVKHGWTVREQVCPNCTEEWELIQSERRRVAPIVLAGLVSNPNLTQHLERHKLVETAVLLTDALLETLDQGIKTD